MKKSVSEKISNIPVDEQPDIIVVSNRLFMRMGLYREFTEYGQENSDYYKKDGFLKKQKDIENHKFMTCWDLGENTVLTFMLYLTNWLKMAGSRSANLFNYLQPGEEFGTEF